MQDKLSCILENQARIMLALAVLISDKEMSNLLLVAANMVELQLEEWQNAPQK